MKHVKIGYMIVVIERRAEGDGEPLVGFVTKRLGDGTINAIAFPPFGSDLDPHFDGICHADDVPAPAKGVVHVWRGLHEQWDIDDTAALYPVPIDPQNEINKRANIDNTTRAARAGWMYHDAPTTSEQMPTATDPNAGSLPR